MNVLAVVLLASILVVFRGAYAQGDVVTPPPALILDGVPSIPSELAAKINPYAEFRPHGLLSWHPQRREVLVRRRLNATTQVHLVTEPGATPQPLTDFPDAVGNAAYQPTSGSYFLFARASGGNEVFRIYRQDLATKAVTPLSPEGVRASAPIWNRQGDLIVYATQPIDRNNPERTARTSIHVMDPLQPASDRVLATLEGGGWEQFAFSENGDQIAFVEFVSINESYIWVMDLRTGQRRRITPAPGGELVAYDSPRFSKDGKSIFVLSDRASEYRRLMMIPVAGGKERVLTANIEHNVDAFDISFEANRIAFLTNEGGSSVLNFMELTTFKQQSPPSFPRGVIGGLRWRLKSTEIGFHMSSARSAGDVYSYDVKSGKVTRWTSGASPELDAGVFAEPRFIKWKSFDGLDITGFHYHPAARFTGKRPVIVSIHGGPEAQFRPGFIGRANYYLNELGVGIIYPNVRGSAGFGKSFLKLDNGKKREDSVKDIGALLDWIKEQPDLDATRVSITGASYGGYMTLACAVHFADRISGAVSVVGISNFVTFLERTESYRRDLRRAEYGDEREPGMRAFLESISPLNHADRITKPLLVVQGLNDPRVPYTEAEQIVANLKQRGAPVWFLMARDEGHGFVKKHNIDYQFYATVEFVRRTLLK